MTIVVNGRQVQGALDLFPASFAEGVVWNPHAVLSDGEERKFLLLSGIVSCLSVDLFILANNIFYIGLNSQVHCMVRIRHAKLILRLLEPVICTST